MTEGGLGRGEQRQGARETLDFGGFRLYGSLLSYVFGLCVNVVLYRWTFRRGYEKQRENLGTHELVAFLVFSIVAGTILYIAAKGIVNRILSAKQVVREGDSILVQRLMGSWQGSIWNLHLRKVPFGLFPTNGQKGLVLESSTGGRVAEIIVLTPEAQQALRRLQQWFQDAGREDLAVWRSVRKVLAEQTKRALSVFYRRCPWVGRVLFWLHIIGAYGALVVAAAMLFQLSWLSISILMTMVCDGVVLVVVLGRTREGRASRQMLEYAFTVLQVLVAGLVVSVAWDWLGREHGQVWLVVLVGIFQLLAVGLEWAVPGSVVAPYPEKEQDRPQVG